MIKKLFCNIKALFIMNLNYSYFAIQSCYLKILLYVCNVFKTKHYEKILNKLLQVHV